MGLLICVFCILMINACKKKEATPTAPTVSNPTYPPETETAVLHALFTMFNNDITNIGAQISEEGLLYAYKSSVKKESILSSLNCYSITVTGSVATVDFGADYCYGEDGRKRKGKLIFDFSGSPTGTYSFKNPGFEFNVSAQNYAVDVFTLNIQYKKVTNTCPLSIATQTAFNGLNLTWRDSSRIEFFWISGPTNSVSLISTETITLINSNDTSAYRGQFKPLLIAGSTFVCDNFSSGDAFRHGAPDCPIEESFTASSSGLLRDFKCKPTGLQYSNWHPYLKGIILFYPGTRTSRVLDFGTGTCDRFTKIQIGDHVNEVDLY